MTVNSRLPDFLKGDFWAGIAAVRIGARRLVELVRKYGVGTFKSAHAALHGLRRAGLARRSRACRRAASSSRRSRTTARLQGQDRDHRGRRSSSTSATIPTRTRPDQCQPRRRDGLRADGVQVVDRRLMLRQRRLVPADARCMTRPGSVFHAKEPAAIGFYYEIGIRVFDLMLRCLAPHMPDRLPAGNFASICGTFIGGPHPDTGRHYTIIEPQLGGWGASSAATATARSSPASTARPSIARPKSPRRATAWPSIAWRSTRSRAARADGAAARASRSIIACAPTTISSPSAIRARAFRPGASRAAGTARPTMSRSSEPTASANAIAASGVIVNTGDVIRIVTGNGGGYGDPSERERKAVLDDIDSGYLMLRRAAEVYGVERREHRRAAKWRDGDIHSLHRGGGCSIRAATSSWTALRSWSRTIASGRFQISRSRRRARRGSILPATP